MMLVKIQLCITEINDILKYIQTENMSIRNFYRPQTFER